MKYLILFAGLFYFSIAAAQEAGMVIQLSLDESSCREGMQYQINVQLCHSAGYEEMGEMGRMSSHYDWSGFEGVDATFSCDEHYSSMGCEANFRSPGYALDKVLNISIVEIDGDNMNMMQLLLPIKEADLQTVIDIRDIPFRSGSFNLKDKTKTRNINQRSHTLLLTVDPSAF